MLVRPSDNVASPAGAGYMRSTFQAVGSLWFASVLLVLWLVAMACATVYESTHGTEQALAAFYASWWFAAILALLAVNVVAAVIARYPFTKRQIGFVLTHVGILATFAGALVTKRYAVDGHVGIAEGQTVQSFSVGRPVLAVAGGAGDEHSTVDLEGAAFQGFRVVDHPDAPALSLNDMRVEVLRYLPDSEASQAVVDDNPHPQTAVEVSLSPSGRADPVWVFAGQRATPGGAPVACRQVGDEAELQRLLHEPPATQPSDTGTVRVEYRDSTFDVPVEACTGEAVALGNTGYTVRVLQYLPHAVVGPGGQVGSASDRPENPAVQYEVLGEGASQKGWAFSRFPEFSSMHGAKQLEGLKVTFTGPRSAAPPVPIEVFSGPGAELHVRFSADGAAPALQRLELDTPVETPWEGLKFAVLRRYDHARIDRPVEPVEPVRTERTPALLVELTGPEQSRQTWLQKYDPRTVTVGGASYELTFADKTVPLGFDLTLNKFEVGYYPGGRRPRSFESSITVVDPTTGGSQSRVVSMNHPVKFGGYSLYQSSYRQTSGRSVSFLSVARDPGKPIVFAGYIATMIGMVWVLGIRIADRRRLARVPTVDGAYGKTQLVAIGLPPRRPADARAPVGTPSRD